MIWREASRLANIDSRTEAALVATAQEDGREQIVGVARLACRAEGECEAEVAFNLWGRGVCGGAAAAHPT